MKQVRTVAVIWAIAIWCGVLHGQRPTPRGGLLPGGQFPDGPGRDVTQKVCGATCHGPDIIMGTGRTRAQWTGVVNSMISRGAKASDAELVQIVEYLSSHFGPNMVAVAPPRGNRPAGRAPTTAGRGPGPLGAGAADSHVVDTAAADRGKTVYIAECITCHGNKARGGNPSLPPNQQGADLIRSLVVLHDRYGNEIGPFLTKGHPLQSGRPSTSLTKEQLNDLAHFLHQRVYFTLRSGPELEVKSVVTGNPASGASYFNGAGKCNTCHSLTGDLAGIGKKYDPPTLQLKFLFPWTVGFGRAGAGARPSKQATVKVTQPNGEVIEGVLDRLDDFNVSLRDSRGDYHAFKRTEGLKVEKHDPYAAHIALLDRYSDDDIHNVVAYLVSLK
jgi:cytochrome c oxidase cbb3-type subunit III